MNRVIIYPYKMGSQSAKALATALREQGIKTLRVYPNRHYRQRMNDIIISWGNSQTPDWLVSNTNWINPTHSIHYAANKLKTFQKLSEAQVPTVNWTTNQQEASRWMEWDKVFARTTLTGHSGQGIIVCTDALIDAPLYTKGFKKTNEFRVHVFNGQILDLQEKRRRAVAGNRSDCDVWSHGNDFIFARQNLSVPEDVQQAAIKAIEALGLHFGAVDIGWDVNENKCAVFEVNTACGLTGTTLNKYVEAIANLME